MSSARAEEVVITPPDIASKLAAKLPYFYDQVGQFLPYLFGIFMFIISIRIVSTLAKSFFH
jgi:hypothetical protein